MKKLLLAMIILGVALTTAHAQYFFNKREPSHSFFSIYTAVIPMDGKYYCVGDCWDSVNYIGGGQAYPVEGIKFIVFDQSGNKLRDTVYQYQNNDRNIETINSMGTAYALPDKSIMIASNSIDSFGVYRLMLTRLDTMGHYIWSKDYDQSFCTGSNFYKIRDFKPAGTGEWLMLSVVSCPVTGYGKPVDFVLTKLDSSFNIIWEKKYGDPYLHDLPCRILVEPDGYLLAGGRNNANYTNINYSFRAELIKTDTAGAVKWTWLSDPSKLTGPIQDIVRTSDSGYVFCGTGWGYEMTGGSSSDVAMKGLVQKIDKNRNMVWGDTVGLAFSNIGSNNQNVIKQLNNGDLIVAGSTTANLWTLPSGDTSGLIFGSLIRLNALGQVLWAKKYTSVQPDTFSYKVYDMKVTDDGGYIFAGESTDDFYVPQTPPIQRGWIVKVDSNGCLGNNDPQCWKAGINEITNSDSKAMIYPNPAQDMLHVQTTLKFAQMILTLYDLAGKALMQATVTNGSDIDISGLSPGMYVYRLAIDNQPAQAGKIVKE